MATISQQRIKEALIELDEGMKSTDTSKMVAGMERLDGLVAEAGNTLDPRLRHFLERRSYAKAIALLGGGAPE